MVPADVNNTQIGDLLSIGSFGTFDLSGLPGESYDLRLTVWAGGTSEQVVVTALAVPEPASLALLGLGLAALARRRRRKGRSPRRARRGHTTTQGAQAHSKAQGRRVSARPDPTPPLPAG